MADEVAQEDEGAPKKKSALMMTIVGVLVLTLVGAGGGWLVGNLLAPGVSQAEAEAEKVKARPACRRAGSRRAMAANTVKARKKRACRASRRRRTARFSSSRSPPISPIRAIAGFVSKWR
ncbi:MAG: hypothetical protein QM775_25565 [Pirellulales bacterium]